MSNGGVVDLKSPISTSAMRGSLIENGRLQACRMLTAADCQTLNAFLQAHPSVTLRIYRDPGSKSRFDWSHLAMLPALRNVWIDVDAGDLNDLAPLAHLPADLTSLTLDTVAPYSGKTKDKAKQNVSVLSRLTRLQDLTLCGQLKALDFLAPLVSLRRLGLWRCKLTTLAGIESLSEFQHLQLHASGAKDLGPLSALRNLKSLEIQDQRNLSSLDPVCELHSLERLWLVSCGSALPLPSFASLKNLKVLVIDKLATPENLHLVAAAPALRCLILSGSPALNSVEALAPLAGHRSLKEVRLETFNEKLHKAIADRYGWKVDYCNYPADEYL